MQIKKVCEGRVGPLPLIDNECGKESGGQFLADTLSRSVEFLTEQEKESPSSVELERRG